MEIKVFGPGCAKCKETEKLIREAVKASGKDITVEKVSDLQQMLAAGVMSTPAVAIDGVVKTTGRVPSKKDIAAWIDGAGDAPSSPASCGGCCSCGGNC
ncbi:thioredoxin family protein [Desulfoplanes formicivorans]|uniref:Glutaredoxin n=1 Tax=Desulfoplanes formicivorans TaxID=1592317 RepID=A0A194ALG0_9BACT|nr:thioredoxin family protein [Desulfoplanes formicivorans]GAU09504.1 glutaredoxin [Desulfoplanes formicivorans]